MFRKVVAVWDGGREAQRPEAKARTAVGTRARHRLSRGRPAGILEALRNRVVTSSLEEVVFLVMFLAFVGFSIDWLLKILG